MKINMENAERDFKWVNPVPGKTWNTSYGGKTVLIGEVNGQVLVRIDDSKGKQDLYARLIFEESHEGQASQTIDSAINIDILKDTVMDALFGRLRNFTTCSCCSKISRIDGWGEAIEKRLAESNLCFSCDHWQKLATKLQNPLVVVVDGHYYTIDKRENMDSSCKGFAGGKFVIKWLDGRPDTTTTNLWHGGSIPSEFLSKFPDNAEFVREEYYPVDKV